MYALTVTVSDRTFESDTKTLTLTADGNDPIPIQIVTANGLPDARVGINYATVIRATGGAGGTRTFTLEDIQPAPATGPTLSTDTGVLEWGATDLVAGTYLITIRVEDDGIPASEDVATLELTVLP